MPSACARATRRSAVPAAGGVRKSKSRNPRCASRVTVCVSVCESTHVRAKKKTVLREPIVSTIQYNRRHTHSEAGAGRVDHGETCAGERRTPFGPRRESVVVEQSHPHMATVNPVGTRRTCTQCATKSAHAAAARSCAAARAPASLLVLRSVVERLLGNKHQPRVLALDRRRIPGHEAAKGACARSPCARRDAARCHPVGDGQHAYQALSLMYWTGQPRPSPPVFATSPSTTIGSL